MTDYKNDPFFDVPRTTISTSAGEAEFPIFYYLVSSLILLFPVEYDRVAGKLSKLGLKPGLRWGKKAIVGLGFYEYLKTSIGPYNEVGLAIPALMQDERPPLSGWLDMYSNLNTRKLGFYIVDLPVTTEIAWAAGCEMWGFPKFITDISVRLDSKSFHGDLMDPESQEPIITVSGKLGLGIPSIPMSLALFSQLNGKMLRSLVNVRGPVKMRGKGGLRVEVSNSNHIMARNLRDLGLDKAQPLLVMDTNRFQSHLYLGEEVAKPSN